MTEQLRLFKLTAGELEQMASLATQLQIEILGLGHQLKSAQKELRESSEAEAVKDIKSQVADAKDRLAEVLERMGAAHSEVE